VDRADITNPATGTTVEDGSLTHGFDLSAWTSDAGTLAKNISFLLVPAAGNDAVFALNPRTFARSNLLKSSWLNH